MPPPEKPPAVIQLCVELPSPPLAAEQCIELPSTILAAEQLAQPPPSHACYILHLARLGPTGKDRAPADLKALMEHDKAGGGAEVLAATGRPANLHVHTGSAGDVRRQGRGEG